MLYQLSREEVLKVCSTCKSYDPQAERCLAVPEERKALHEVKKCKSWDRYYGGPCLFRG